ncbi:MAG: hypothetical protein ACRENN_10955, partial [Candidatus Eiseniibacteriota bacterium]
TAGMAYAADGSGSGSGSGKPAAAAVGHPRLRLAVRRHAAKIVADTLGVSTQDLRTALRGGQSVNEYAGTFGPEKPGEVKTALVNAANSAIDKAVANGRIDQARGDELKGKVEARVDQAMDHHFGQGQGGA